MKKKLIVGMLVLAMLVACLSVSAFAADNSAVANSGQASGQMTADQFKATAKSGKITLTGDVTISDEKDITFDGLNITIDLAGHTLKLPDSHSIVFLPTGGGKFTRKSLTITDSSDNKTGKISGNSSGHALIYSVGSYITLKLTGGTIEDKGTFAAIGITGDGSNSTIEVDGATISCTEESTAAGILVNSPHTLNFKSGTIKATNGIGIQTYGGDDNSATINVSGGTIDAGVGVYLPAGTMTVSGGTIKGQAGIVVRGGELTVTGGTIEATGKDNIQVGDAQTQVPAAGITVDYAGYKNQEGGQTHVTISGGEIKGPESGKSIVACDKGTEIKAEESDNGKAKKSPFNITGGTFKAGEATETTQVSQYLPEDYTYENGEVKEDINDSDVVATVGELKFKDLKSAIAAAEGGNTVVLQKDVELPYDEDGNGRITVDKTVTIDLNGKKLTKKADAAENKAGLLVGQGGNLTLTDSGETKGKISGKNGLILVKDGGELTLDGVAVEQTGSAESKNYGAVYVTGENSVVTVKKGTTIKADHSGIDVRTKATLNFNSGKVDAEIFGIMTNGTKSGEGDGSGAKIFVRGGEITGDGAGMYLPSSGGKTSITGGKISGAYGIVVRGGTISISGDETSVTATGSEPGSIGDAGSKTLPVAAVVVDHDTDYGTSGAVSANITGGTFTSEKTENSVVYTEDGKTDNVTDKDNNLVIAGGTFLAKGEGDKPTADESVKKYLEPNLTTDENGKVKLADEAVLVTAVQDANKNTADVSYELINGKVEVTVSGSVSTSHSEASQTNTWWAGVGLVAPSTATKGTFKFSDATEEQTFTSLDTWHDENDVERKGLSIWFDAAKENTFMVTVTWKNGTDQVVCVNVYRVIVDRNIVIEPFTTEVVDFGYGATRQDALNEAVKLRPDWKENKYGEENKPYWDPDKEDESVSDWADQTMWVTFADPIPDGVTITLTLTTPNGTTETQDCEGNGVARTFAWSYKNTEQTGETSVQVGDYILESAEGEDGASADVSGKNKLTVGVDGSGAETTGSGFAADNETAVAAMKAAYEALGGTDENAFDDAGNNVLWAAFKTVPPQSEAKEFTVFVLKDGERVGTTKDGEKVTMTKGAVMYYSLDGQLKDLASKSGEYVIELVNSDDVAVASAVIEIYEVKYEKGSFNFDADELAALASYAPDSNVTASSEAPAKDKDGKSVTWVKSVDEETYTITFTATAPAPVVGSSAPTTAKVEKTENGSVKLSSTTARAGQTVTITPKADKGYEVDEITVTDKNGEAVEVKKNEDGTYSFTMPTATPVTVKVTFSKIDPAATFVDVAEDAEDWYLDELLELMVEHPGLINGDLNDDGERVFRPHDSMTRAEFAKIVFVMAGGEAVDIENPFTDMDEGDWYYDYILWACSENIMGGNGDGTVSPEENITRDQAVAMLHRWVGEPEAEDDAVLDSFPDAAEVEDYAAVAMAWAVEAGVIQGDDTGSINPTDDIQRCEMVAILVRCLDTVAAE